MKAGDVQKRYRWTSFFIDTTRNGLRNQNLPAGVRAHQASEEKGLLARSHGEIDIGTKFDRWLRLEPPSFCAPPEYHELLREVESSYIHGDHFPALTGACCLGERVLHELVFGLKEDFTHTRTYKRVANKKSIQDWPTSIGILTDWSIIDSETAAAFDELHNLRDPAVHVGNVDSRAQQAARAVQLVYAVTATLFGEQHPRFFRAPGEIYVSREFEADPFTMKFVLPHCTKLGYRHTVEGGPGQAVIRDPEPYADEPLTDEEFAERRAERQAQRQ